MNAYTSELQRFLDQHKRVYIGAKNFTYTVDTAMHVSPGGKLRGRSPYLRERAWMRVLVWLSIWHEFAPTDQEGTP